MPGLIYVTSLYTFPVVFILTSAALSVTPADLEEAARIAGAGRLAVMRTITLPLALPAIVGGFILAFLEALVLFGAPAMLAIPARFHVMTTQIWAFFHYPPQVEVAAAYAMPLLLVAVVLLVVQRRLMGRRGYATWAGAPRPRPRRARSLAVGRSRACGACCCSIGLPYFALLRAALAKVGARVVVAEPHPAQLPLRHLRVRPDALGHREHARAGVRHRHHRRPPHGRDRLRRPAAAHHGARALAFLAMAPLAIPGIVLSIGLFKAYSRPPLLLYGTIWIIFVAYLTKYLPIAYTACHAAIQTVHVDLEDAARTLGANRLVAFKDVTMPLFSAGLVSAWLLVFLPSLRELSSSILLFTSCSRVVSVVIYSLYEEGLWEAVSALGILLLGLTSPSWPWRSGSAAASSRSDRGMAAVRLEALTKRYGEDVAAVRDLSLEIRHGELVSLLGPSGCGKTTTLRLIAGFLVPDAGEIWLGDRRLSSPGRPCRPSGAG